MCKNVTFRVLLLALCLGSWPILLNATIYNCSSVADIRAAMNNVGPGDEIVIAPGTYYPSSVAASGTGSHFYCATDGTASQPITIRSADPANPALLHGENSGSLTLLRILGDYWIVRDLRVTNAQKGIIFDNANHGQIINCEVFGIGYEAIHIRDGSDYALIDGCTIYDTGRNKPGFGEAIYIGSDKGSWDRYDPYVDHTTVRNCTIGPNVKAEAFDIKEGTAETIVEYCTVDATGISGSNYADSFIDLKGTRTYVRYNTFIRNGATILNKGIAGIDRNVPLSCYEHAIHDNVFYMDTPDSGPMVDAYSGVQDIYAWDNIRYPAGETYGSNITGSCCPSWYNPSGASCAPPSALATSNVTTDAATLTWNTSTDAIDYDLRYRANGTSNWTDITGWTSASYPLTGLNANTIYQWEVRSYCNDQQSAYVPGADFTTQSDNSGGGDTGGGDTGGGDDTNVGVVLYDDALHADWNDYSFGGSYDLAYTAETSVGSQAIRADYGSWGGLNIKHNSQIDATELTALRFWVKGAGSYLIRLKVNGAQYEFSTTTAWEQFTIDLSEVGNPSTIESVVFQNRSSSSRTVYFDQIEFLGADDGMAGGGDTDGGGDTGGGDGDGTGDTGGGDTGGGDGGDTGGNPPSPNGVYTDALGTGWNDYSFSGNYDLAYTTDVPVGSFAIRADYSGYGGLNLKHDDDLDASNLTAIRFWVKGEGAYLIRLKVNKKRYHFTTTTEWQQLTIPLTEFDSPDLIDAVVLQNRSSSNRTVYYDQIEFVGNESQNLQMTSPPVVATQDRMTTWRVYPNPVASTFVNVDLPELTTTRTDWNITVWNALGQPVAQYQLPVTNQTHQLTLPPQLTNGTYWFTAQNGEVRSQQMLQVMR